MAKRIHALKESPCYKCGVKNRCTNKVRKSPLLEEIVDSMFGNAEKDYKECGLYISLTAPDMVEEE